MDKVLNFFGFERSQDDFKILAEKQLYKNMEVIKSLQHYDEGKKDISTNDIEKFFPNIKN